MLSSFTLLLQIAAASAYPMPPATCDVRASGYYCQSAEANGAPCATYPEATHPEPVLAALETQHRLLEQATRDSTAGSWLAVTCSDVFLALRAFVPDPQHKYLVLLRARPSWYERAIQSALTAARVAPDSDTRSVVLLSALLIQSHPGRPDPRHVDLPYVATLTADRPSRKHLTGYLREGLPLIIAAAARHPDNGPLLRACTSVALDAAEYAAAHTCAVQAAIDQYDMTWTLLRMAWLAIHDADTTGGTSAFRTALSFAQNPLARQDLGWHLESGIDESVEWGTPGIDPTSPALMTERVAWLAMPLDSVIRLVAEDSIARDGWVALATPAQLAAHFIGTAFSTEAFRACMPGEREQPCGGTPSRGLNAARLRVWSDDGATLALVPYRWSGDTTRAAADASRREIRLRQWNLAGRMQDDTAALPQVDKGRAFAEGLMIVPTDSALDSWMLEPGPPGSGAGAFQDFQAPLAGGAGGGLVMSDLIVGTANSRIRWHYDDRKVPIATSDSFDRREPITVAFQVRCVECDVLHRSIRVYRLPDRTGATPSVAVSNEVPGGSGITLLSTQLDMSHLKTGAYRVEVEVRSDGIAEPVRSARNVVIR